MVLGAFLEQPAVVHLVEDVMAHVLQQAFRHEQALDEGFKGEAVADDLAAVGAFPGGEPLQTAAELAAESDLSVTDHRKGVVH